MGRLLLFSIKWKKCIFPIFNKSKLIISITIIITIILFIIFTKTNKGQNININSTNNINPKYNNINIVIN